MAERLTREQAKALGFVVEKTPRLTPAQAQEIGFDQPAAIRQFGGPPPQVTPGETFAIRGAEAVPAGGLLTDLLSTGVIQAAKALGVGDPGATLTPEAQAELYRMGLSEAEVKDPGNTIPGAVDTYRGTKALRRTLSREGAKQNPNAALAGDVTGTVASILAPLPTVTVGANAATRGGQLASRLGSGAATGALYGGVSGFADGEADLTRGELGKAAEETAAGALGGALFGAGAAGVAEAARPLLTNPLRRLGINQGRQTIQGQSDIAAATRRPLSDEAVEEVLRSGAIRPLSTTQATYARVDRLAEEQGAAYGALLSRLEELGVRGPRARELADELMARYQQELLETGANKAVPRVFRSEARNIEDIARGGPGQAGPMVERLGLNNAEQVKRALQRDARFERLRASPKEEALQETSSRLRAAIEDAVEEAGAAAPANSEVRRLAESFVPVKQRTGRLLEARTAAERGASKADQRSPIGLKDVVLGSATGEPLSALALSGLSGVARNRLPSTISANAYNLSEALRTGAASPRLAQMIAIAADPDVRDTSKALADALRKRNQKRKDER